MTTKPRKTFRAGPCRAAVFVNQRQTPNGPMELPSIAFSCRYRDEATGEWKDSGSMRPNEAARAVQIPIIGMGGIMTAEDAVEFMLAGATAVKAFWEVFRQQIRMALARHESRDLTVVDG